MFNVELFAATRGKFYCHTWELYFDDAKVLHFDCGLRMFAAIILRFFEDYAVMNVMCHECH